MTLPIIPGNKSQKPVKTIVVNTNKDGTKKDGVTTLREALKQVELGSDQHVFNIVFNADDKESATNDLGLNYWTIELESPLLLKSGSVSINSVNPQNITLVPEHQGKGINRKEITGLLVQQDSKTSAPDLKVALNRINFAEFKAKGEDAPEGGGGGGGMGGGGAIVLRGGELSITNSVFQNNRAEGGSGASGALGGELDNVDTQRRGGGLRNKGNDGGIGGKPSFPDSENVIQKKAVGGRSPDISFVRRNMFNDRSYDSSPGANGQELTQTYNQGYGGYGGGGGGGGLSVSSSCCVRYSKAGNGGNGGVGGLGAGSGGGGGAGGLLHYARKTLPGPSGGTGGIAPPFGTAGGSGGSSAFNPGVKDPGGKGGNGSALGGGVIVLKGQSQSKLNLWNVDFISNTASSQGGTTYNQLFQEPDEGEQTQINFLKLSTDDQDNTINYWKSNDSLNNSGSSLASQKVDNSEFFMDPKSIIVKQEDQPRVGDAPIYLGRSYITNPNVIRLRPISQVIENTTGISETNIIKFDSASSGRIFINGDFSDFENGIKDIWKDLYPDKSAEINKKYGSSVLQSILQSVGKTLSGGYAIAYPNVTNSEKLSSLLQGNILSLATSVVSDYLAKEQALKENAANQAKLRQKLQQNMTAKFAPIDITSSRTMVKIDNFTLGEDIVEIPDLGDQPPQIGIQGGGSVTISNGNNDGNPNIIARLNIDRNSFAELDQSGRSKADYISNMFFKSPTSGGWKLGKYASAFPLKQLTNEYIGGPASTTLLIQRKGKSPNQVFSTTTFSGDDQIIGTPGRESIEAGAGMDIVFPNAGADTVDGGNGIDYIVLSDLQKPVNINYSSTANNFSASSSENTINSEFKNIEVINAYSGSKIDFSELPEPDPVTVDHWGTRIGAGSEFIGSKYDDRIVLSFQDKEFSSVDPTNPTRVIDGGDGNNSLEIDAPADLNVNVEHDNNCNTLLIKHGDQVVNQAKNIETIYFKGTDSNNILNSCSGSTRASSIALFANGSGGNDTIYGGKKKDTVAGGRQNDLIEGRHSSDSLTGGNGRDTMKGGAGSDYINGGNHNDFIQGGASSDSLIGRGGNDSIAGGTGRDTIIAGTGKDTINGGAGNDELWGGKNKDQFNLSKGNDIIYDYNSKHDQLQAPESDSNLDIFAAGNDTVVTSTNGINTLIKNTRPSQLNLSSPQ